MMAWTYQGVEIEPTADEIEAALAGIIADAAREGRALTEHEARDIGELAALVERVSE